METYREDFKDVSLKDRILKSGINIYVKQKVVISGGGHSRLKNH
jgi:hypothetical protein